MPLYEHVYLARQDVSQQQVDAMTAEFKQLIEENGGSVGKTEYWGVKSLTYKIKKNRKAHFTLLNIDAAAIMHNIPTALRGAPLPNGADAVVMGEGEETIPLWLESWRAGEPRGKFESPHKPDVTTTPPPRSKIATRSDFSATSRANGSQLKFRTPVSISRRSFCSSTLRYRVEASPSPVSISIRPLPAIANQPDASPG